MGKAMLHKPGQYHTPKNMPVPREGIVSVAKPGREYPFEWVEKGSVVPPLGYTFVPETRTVGASIHAGKPYTVYRAIPEQDISNPLMPYQARPDQVALPQGMVGQLSSEQRERILRGQYTPQDAMRGSMFAPLAGIFPVVGPHAARRARGESPTWVDRMVAGVDLLGILAPVGVRAARGPRIRGTLPRKPTVRPLPRTAVVDPSGQPKRLFHGTRAAFERFDPTKHDPGALFGPGYYFTDNPGIASSYAEGGGTKVYKFSRTLEGAQRQGAQLEAAGHYVVIDPVGADSYPFKYVVRYAPPSYKPNVRPAYVDIRQPFQVDHERTWGVARNIAQRQGWDTKVIDEYRHTYLGGASPRFNPYEALANSIPENARLSVDMEGRRQILNSVLRDHGYDGIHYRGGKRLGLNKEHDVWVAFDQSQIYNAVLPPQARADLFRKLLAAGKSVATVSAMVIAADMQGSRGHGQP